MRSYLLTSMLAAAVVAAPVVVNGQFVDDQFDGTELGAHWTFGDNSPGSPGSMTMGGGYLTLEGGLDGDHFWWNNNYTYVEQDAPAGTDWEVIAKVDDWDPTLNNEGRAVARIGLQIFQDAEHAVTISVLGNWGATGFNGQSFWRFDPDHDGANDGFHKGVLDLLGWPAAPQSTIYFKMQKTTRGYRGFVSFDGTDYLEILNIARNPETSDGYMTNEKIRLFMAGGFGREGEVTVPTPAQFDYVISNPLPPALPYADEEFSGPELGAQWDVNPGIGVGSMYFDTLAGEFVMTGGPHSDMWGHIEQPTYIFQDAPQADVYSLTMKGSPTLMHEIPFELYNSYGIWLWQDTLNWAFISNQRGELPAGTDPQTYIPNNRLEFGAKFGGAFHNGNHPFGTGPTPEYLRILKAHDTVQLQYSFDNSTWSSVQLGGLTNLPVTGDGLQVRLFTKRAFGDFDDEAPGIQNPPLDARFDWLRAEIDTSNVNDWQLY